jgi:hypothetical protein
MKTKIHLYLLLAVAGSVIFAQISGFAISSPRVSAIGGVAGYGATFTVSGFGAYQPLYYLITSPDGRQSTLNGYTDGDGSTTYHLAEQYTKSAGVYRVQVQEGSGKLASKVTMFTVYPDQTSSSTSEFQISKSYVSADAYDFAVAKVRLVDSAGNPLAQHFIQIVSDRADDLIKPYTPGVFSTDTNGEVRYALTSKKVGVSTYTAYDVAAQMTVGSPIAVQYVTGTAPQTASTVAPAVASTSSLMTGSFLQASILGVGGDITNAGPAYSFSFEDMPVSVKTNQPIDFTVTAYDITQNVAAGYQGTVHFSAVGSNNVYASFPQDYTFTPSDLGKHTFPLALQFQQEGTYQIQVQDTVKQTLLGTISIIVKGGANATSNSSSTVTITAPSPGSYGSNIQTISGLAPSGKDVKIYDNSEEIGTVVAGNTGSFDYTTQPLADGPHEFAAISVDSKGVVIGSSDKVAITINTKPPALQDVQLIPGFSVTTGVTAQIQVTSDAHLKSLTLNVAGDQSDLVEDVNQPGLYHGSFATPVEAGSYDLSFAITDALNNQSTVVHNQQLTVTAGTSQALAAVKNVKSTPGAYRVTLTWDDTDNVATSVKNYRIFYGSSPTQLTSFADTVGNVHQWYIPNLQNGVTYYFGVVAVDQSGNFGAGGTLALGTPNDPKSIGGLPSADTIIGSPGVYGETGPEILWLAPLSIGLYQGTRKLRKGRTTARR